MQLRDVLLQLGNGREYVHVRLLRDLRLRLRRIAHDRRDAKPLPLLPVYLHRQACRVFVGADNGNKFGYRQGVDNPGEDKPPAVEEGHKYYGEECQVPPRGNVNHVNEQIDKRDRNCKIGKHRHQNLRWLNGALILYISRT